MARLAVLLVLTVLVMPLRAETLRVGVFEVDASPPVGSPLAYDPTKAVESPLSCRGVVLVGAGQADRAVCDRLDWDQQRRADGVSGSDRGSGEHGAEPRGGAYAPSTRCPAVRFLRRRIVEGTGRQRGGI